MSAAYAGSISELSNSAVPNPSSTKPYKGTVQIAVYISSGYSSGGWHIYVEGHDKGAIYTSNGNITITLDYLFEGNGMGSYYVELIDPTGTRRSGIYVYKKNLPTPVVTYAGTISELTHSEEYLGTTTNPYYGKIGIYVYISSGYSSGGWHLYVKGVNKGAIYTSNGTVYITLDQLFSGSGSYVVELYDPDLTLRSSITVYNKSKPSFTWSLYETSSSSSPWFSNTYSAGSSFNWSIGTPTRSGYVFNYWMNTDGETHVESGTSVVVKSKAWYGVWTQQTTFYLQYDANGGSGAPGTQSATSSNSYYTFRVSSTTPTRSGHSFLGWSTSQTTSNPGYYSGDSITVYASNNPLALYAVWQSVAISPSISVSSRTSNSITCSVNKNGGSAGTWTLQASTTSNFSSIVATVGVSGSSGTLTGLSPNTTYYIRCAHVCNGTAYSNTVTSTTKALYPKFYWSATGVSPAAGVSVSEAIKASGWNDLVTKIRAIPGGSYTGAAAYSGAAIKAADHYNSMADALMSIGANAPSSVSAGQQMTATQFLNIQSYYNSRVDTLNS